MEIEQERYEWEEIFKWRLKPLEKYEASCKHCGKTLIYNEYGLEESILALKNAGWKLRDGGSWCTDCIDKEEAQ